MPGHCLAKVEPPPRPRQTKEPKNQISLREQHRGKACPYCGRIMGGRFSSPKKLSPTIDHIVPVSRGGGNGANKVFVCRRCNEAKGDRTLAEWFEEMMAKPGDPRAEFVWRFMQERGISLCVGLE